jgi:two-component system, OmpR family, alkaline phosphatase synthesis response regulator PhoP
MILNQQQFKILLVDDEPDILEFLSYNLKKENYIVLTASNGDDAIEIANKERPDIIILDLMMPVKDGIVTCGLLRENPKLANTLILFLTARNEDYLQIASFDIGGDDFITKPVKPKLLVARIKAMTRRLNKEENNQLVSYGDIKIDREKFRVTVKEVEIVLTKKEFDLLLLLISKPGKVFERDYIMNEVWGREVIVGDRTIDVHMSKLREKLGENYIKTVKGMGYKFES